MSILLHIDTATENAVVSISEDKSILDFRTNGDQKDHASFLHTAIKTLFENTGMPANKLDAVSVTAGPGSYTGLRVGMAAAKGFCFALSIPLVTVSTLEVMALACMMEVKDTAALYCPMIDARRMEVFTATYDHLLAEIIKPCSMILEDDPFRDLLKTQRMYFSGSGAGKLKKKLNDKNAAFIDSKISPQPMAELAGKKYLQQDFADVLYASPAYIKEFYTPAKKA